MSDKLVTVMIPSYNHAQYIETAIASVLNQTHKNLELIVIDDGSTDRSHEVLKRYIGRDRIRIVIHKENRGQSAVFNEAIDMAKGEFISLLPSDDWYLPRKTELQLKKFEQSSPKTGVVYGTGICYNQNTGDQQVHDVKKYRGNILKEMLTQPFCVFPASPMFRRECFDKVRFDESYRAEGEALYVKLAIDWEFDYVEEPVAVMREHTYNVGKNVDLMYAENLRYWTEFFALPELPEDVRALKNVRIGMLKRLKGIEKITLNRSYAEGRQLLIEAVKLQPGYLLDKSVVKALLLASLPQGVANQMLKMKYGKT